MNAESDSDINPNPSRGGGLRVLDGMGRTLPHSPEAEEYLLSCCLLDGSATVGKVPRCAAHTQAFYSPAHALVFKTVTKIHRRGQQPDIAVVAEELRTAKQLDQWAASISCCGCQARADRRAGSVYFIAKGARLWVLREIITHGTAAVESAFNYEGDLRGLLETQQGKWSAMLDCVRTEDESMAERAARAAQRTRDLIAGRADRSRCLYTGLRRFDERYGAFDVMEEDWLIGLGAVTSGGKERPGPAVDNAFLERRQDRHRVPAGDELGQVARPERGRRGAHQCPQARPVARGPGGKFLADRDRREACLDSVCNL